MLARNSGPRNPTILARVTRQLLNAGPQFWPA